MVFCVSKNSRSRFLRLVFPVRFVAKRYILQQKCLEGQIETCLLGIRWFLLALYTDPESHNAQRYRQTDGRHDAANSRSYCVAVRSAKNARTTRRQISHAQSGFLAPKSKFGIAVILAATVFTARCYAEAVIPQKPAISPKWCKIGPRLLYVLSIGAKINDLRWPWTAETSLLRLLLAIMFGNFISLYLGYVYSICSPASVDCC